MVIMLLTNEARFRVTFFYENLKKQLYQLKIIDFTNILG